MKYPPVRPNTATSVPELSKEALLDLYRAMISARLLDEEELSMTQRGEAFFHVSGAGHESTAALNPHLIPEDWLHCHYRDKALMIARGIGLEMFFHSLMCKDASHSRGRQMSAHMSAPDLNVLSMVGPVGNNALQAVGVASVIKDDPANPIVICALGDGTTQQGEVLEAIAEAVRSELPVLFLIEDNRFAISTKTPGKTFYWRPDGKAEEFYGIGIRYVDGRLALDCHQVFGEVVSAIRDTRQPAIVVVDSERLVNHTNADDQSVYRSSEELTEAKSTGDPIVHLRRKLIDDGFLEAEIEAVEEDVRKEVRQAQQSSRNSPEPKAIFDSVAPLPPEITDPSREYLGDNGSAERLTMIQAMRAVLRSQMESDPRVVLFGEDIEDPKGDVFGLTKGLGEMFPGQVENSALAEATVVGISIGRALAGRRPVAFLQFADFLPIAYNQIISEMGSMFWRTDGAWQCPVIVMITCGGYRPGLGPFHAQTLESVAAHTPGVDVVMPSTAPEAAGLLNAAFASGRPTLFFYPKSCLNDRNQTTSPDVSKQLTILGKGRLRRSGQDITFVAWGNTVSLCMNAADALELAGVRAEVIDLRSLMPWDKDLVLHSAGKTGHLVVVHEDNHTCGFGAEVVATVAEYSPRKIRVRRVTRPDTFVPCNFGNQLEVLPSFRSTLEAAADLLGFDVEWEAPPSSEPGLFVVDAVGSSPSDESVLVIDWMVAPGDTVEIGQKIASLEADKAMLEMDCPAAGVVEELLAQEGESVRIGSPLLTIRTAGGDLINKAITQEVSGEPTLKRRATPPETADEPKRSSTTTRPTALKVGLGAIAVCKGSRLIGNEELIPGFADAGYDSADIFRRTGIENRVRLAEGESGRSMAVKAAKDALDSENLVLNDIDVIICSTGTPEMTTPSMACLILNDLAGDTDHMAQAYDVSAACSGYLYALQAAYDCLQHNPSGKVLVVTVEALSPLVDPSDFSTAIIFGDAASATVLYGEDNLDRVRALLTRPELSAKGDPALSLAVPLPGDGFVSMDGKRIFSEAVRKMVNILERTCREHGIEVQDLDLVVPHQANQRILDAVQKRINLPPERVYSNLRHLGNTSSNTIPIALAECLPKAATGDRIGLCAFGGGFTFGAGILEVL